MLSIQISILGLTAGADDYMSEPFNPLELVARIKSQLRRCTQFNTFTPEKEGELEIDDLTIQIKVNTFPRLNWRDYSIGFIELNNPGRQIKGVLAWDWQSLKGA